MPQASLDPTGLPALAPRTHCVLIPRDPNYIYAYWDYTEEDIQRLRNQLKFEGEDSQLILRVYDVTRIKFNGSNANHTWDLDVGFSTKSWYIHVWQDNADYCAELGLRCGDDHFVPLIRSNAVHTPSKTTSSRNDLIWQDIKLHKESQPYIKENIQDRYQKLMQRPSKKKSPYAKKPPRIYRLTAQDIHDYYRKLFTRVSPRGRRKAPALSGSLSRRGISWQKVRPLILNPDLIMASHLGTSIENMGKGGASENLFSARGGASEGRLNKKEFFFEIWTELLVYGRTQPDAAVWLNEKGIKLNPDGTFSLRYSLVDGEIPFKFIAQSSDGVQQRHIYTAVERKKTVGFPKMLKGPNG